MELEIELGDYRTVYRTKVAEQWEPGRGCSIHSGSTHPVMHRKKVGLSLCAKINSRWIKDLHVKSKTLRKNIG